ncbi:hypothetical protein [Streptomyces cacaoi]|nr:hypothetical protein [Streptomyces cacaoi]
MHTSLHKCALGEASVSHLRTLAVDAEALQQRLRDSLAGLARLPP